MSSCEVGLCLRTEGEEPFLSDKWWTMWGGNQCYVSLDYSQIQEDLVEFQGNDNIPKGPQYIPVVLRGSVLPGSGWIPIFTLWFYIAVEVLYLTPVYYP